MTRLSGDADADIPFRASVTAAKYDALQTVPVVLVLDNVRSLYNVGAFFRTADNAGVHMLVLSGITPRPPHRGLSKTALGAEHTVRWEHAADALEAIRSWTSSTGSRRFPCAWSSGTRSRASALRCSTRATSACACPR
jgi:tRNA G18 (ribose-2'-O)-methylase SpoU